MWRRVVAACAVALWGIGSAAAPVTVGRASFDTPTDQAWVVQPLAGTETGGRTGAGPLKMANVALWLPGADGTVEALLLFVGSAADVAGEGVSFPDSCDGLKSTPTVVVRDRYATTARGSRDDCLIVAAMKDLPGALRRGAPAAASLLESRSLALPAEGHVVRAIVGEGARRLAGMAFIGATPAGGAAATPARAQASAAAGGSPAHRVAPEVLQWAEAFSAALGTSVDSATGRFVLPRLGTARTAGP